MSLGDRRRLEVELVHPVGAERAEITEVALKACAVAGAVRAAGTEDHVTRLPAELVGGHQLSVDAERPLRVERPATPHRLARVLMVELTALDQDRVSRVGVR